MTMTEVRLYFLMLPARVLVHCKTIAPTLEIAEEQATAFHGPLELNSWGSRSIDDDSAIFGGGTFIPSTYDASVSDQFLEPLRR
jgi:hypothetical protein